MINRRDFMKIAGCVVPYWGLIPVSNAQSIYSGKVLVDIHAGGGLDASSWFDPREADPTLNDYARNGVPAVVAGNLRVAPMANNGAFATANFRRMMVVNGCQQRDQQPRGRHSHACLRDAGNGVRHDAGALRVREGFRPAAAVAEFRRLRHERRARPCDGDAGRQLVPPADFAERAVRGDRLQQGPGRRKDAGHSGREGESAEGRGQPGAAGGNC